MSNKIAQQFGLKKSAHSAQSYRTAQIDLAGILRERQIDLRGEKSPFYQQLASTSSLRAIAHTA